MIPKIIHYCWFGGKEKDELSKSCIASWKKVLADYEFIEWNEKNFDVRSVLFVQQAYEAKQWAFVTDYVRLWCLYNYGGIYLDCDVEVLQTFDPYLQLRAFSCYETASSSDNLLIEAAVMGSEKNGKWLGGVLSLYNNKKFVKDDGTYDMTVIPQIIADYTQKTYIPLSGTRQDSTEDFTIYDCSYFSPKNREENVVDIKEHTVCIHHFNNSWGAPYCKIRGVYKKKYGKIMGVVLFAIAHPCKSVAVIKYHFAERRRKKSAKSNKK